MRQVVPRGALIGFLGVLALLCALHRVEGLGRAGWAVGLASGLVLNLLLARGLGNRVTPTLLPADRVTLTRAALACGVAALTADGLGRPSSGWLSGSLLVGLAAVALVLDAVDGRVARRTMTVSPFGARFDMEADAFLILVLSITVSSQIGWWVMLGGVARYALLGATWPAPWLGRPLTPRRWRKVVAGLQGVVLTVAAAQLLGPTATTVLLLGGLALLAASFGTQVVSLWRLRTQDIEVDECVTAGWSVSGARGAGRARGVECRT
jgi:phosphatidylglycerophosphate synthase